MSNKMPLNYQILTNLDCNLACTYCYETCKNRGKNDLNQIRHYLNALYKRDFGAPDSDKDRTVVLEFIGGETLMYPDLLDLVCCYAATLSYEYKVQRPFHISVSTNGTLFNRPDVQRFVKRWADQLSIGFSIDGTQDIHDACRVDHAGNGSYDRAVEGYKWVRQHVCPRRIGVKATYCHATIDRWAEGVINLIKLGFTDIAANVVFEEQWKKEVMFTIGEQMCRVVDYLFDHDLEEKVHIFQINNDQLDMHTYNPFYKKTQNHCGTCTYMRCLGFDGLVYGCNRFCTMQNPIPLGYLDGDEIIITNQKLIDEVKDQWKHWPEECRECPISGSCPSCSAIPYEHNRADPSEFFAKKPQCGFTYAFTGARIYFSQKLKAKRAGI